MEIASACLPRSVSRPACAVWKSCGPVWRADERLDELKLFPAVVWGRQCCDELGHLRDPGGGSCSETDSSSEWQTQVRNPQLSPVWRGSAFLPVQVGIVGVPSLPACELLQE